jgi:hypothetical protein
MTTTALALGGATFIAAANLIASLNTTLDGQADALRYDIAVNLSHPYPTDQVNAAVRAVPGIATAETWLRTPASVGDAATVNETPTLYGVPADTPTRCGCSPPTATHPWPADPRRAPGRDRSGFEKRGSPRRS